jgi:cell wall-associated NlpC family hydrolase
LQKINFNMLKKLLFFALLLLPSLSFRAQDAAMYTEPETPETASPGIDRADLVGYARQFLGTPYRRGGSDPKKGFDCSGFVNYVFEHFEVDLPRSSREFKSLGKTLKPDEFKVGDIIVFYGFRDRGHIGHVGIVCEANGMKSKFIHASSGKVRRVVISDLASEGYKKRFYKCIDVIR